MTVRIQPLRPEQISAAAALETQCFTDAVTETALRGFAASDTNHYFAALDETGTLIGCGGFSLAADEAEIISVAVSPAARRQGIARALMNRMLTDAASLGGITMYLEVRASNEAARALYLSLGFAEIGVRRNYYRNPREDAVLMKRDIVPLPPQNSSDE